MRILFYRILGRILIIEDHTSISFKYVVAVKGKAVHSFRSRQDAKKDLKENKEFYLSLL